MTNEAKLFDQVTSRRASLRVALTVAAVVCGAIAIIDLLLAPLYAGGHGQGLLSHLNGISNLLAFPGSILAIFTGIRTGHHTTRVAWCVILLANFVLYTLGITIASELWHNLRKRFLRREEPKPEPTDVSRRRVILGGLGAVAASGAIGYPLASATRRYEITRRVFPVRDLPHELDRLRIVQLTDIHHGPWMPISHVRDVVAATNALDPDLILLTGDYVHQSDVYIDPVISALGSLRAKIGILATLGNHDWWEDGPATQRAFARVGIPLMDNARRFITPDRALLSEAPSAGLCIAGVGDYYEDDQHFDEALGDVPAAMPRLLVSHNPDVAEDPAFLQLRPRVDLMLSGHTHGGQIYVPGLGTPVVPSRYGQKHARGLVQGPICPVFISRGVGHTVLPVRVGIRPEIAMIELRQG